ncbi:M23 family metallopeptidase [Pseudomonas sp. F1_0610]|uniref:M23 family metallopeptidase n=1 Tax=Pseudomonas sp. F1_0610 TaxID=3114284 RepID=UPI0039C33190
MKYQFPVKPLAIGYNKLRSAGLVSTESSRFGMVRNAGTRPHQGIDLATPTIGYRCYAVDDAQVAVVRDVGAYGKQVVLKLDTHFFVFYAHLSRIDVTVGQQIKAGTIVGLSGDTGNAKGMTTEILGSHLHFEVRIRALTGYGLDGRLDPLDYFQLDVTN